MTINLFGSGKENLIDAIYLAINSSLENVHTVLPGKIVSWNAGQRKASVEPLVSMKTVKEVDITLPVIDNVPTIFPSGSNFTLRWDIATGDGCLILFSEYGIGNYLNSGGQNQVAADDSSKFNLTDAICIPGLFSFSRASNLPTDNEISITQGGVITIKNSSGTIELKDDGQVDINGNLTVDV